MLLYAQIPGVTARVCWGWELSPRRAPSWEHHSSGAVGVSLVSRNVCESVTAHRDITALFSLLSCPVVPVTAIVPEHSHLDPPPFYPVFFFFLFIFPPPLVCWVLYTVLFSLCPCPWIFPLFGLLSLSARSTRPLLGKTLVWYHIPADPGISGRRAEADGQPVRLCVPSLCPPSSRILQVWEPG